MKENKRKSEIEVGLWQKNAEIFEKMRKKSLTNAVKDSILGVLHYASEKSAGSFVSLRSKITDSKPFAGATKNRASAGAEKNYLCTFTISQRGMLKIESKSNC